MEKYIESLIKSVTLLGQPDWLDYLQVIATIISIIISAWAVIMAIRIPKKIAKQQNAIAIFEKRYQSYIVLQRYDAYATLIKKHDDVEIYKKLFVRIFYDGENAEFKSPNAISKLIQITIPLQQMPFLFKNITIEEIGEMHTTLSNLVWAMGKNQTVEECKNKYIYVLETFMQKHEEYINTTMEQVDNYNECLK